MIKMLGNKTLCDICSSKAIRKARVKKDKEAPATSTEPPTDNVDDLAATTAPPAPTPPPSTQHHHHHHHGAHDEGISI